MHKMWNEIYLSIVIPAYNEAQRIGETLRKINEYLGTKKFNSEIIVVDDGSSDGTLEAAKPSNIECLTLRVSPNMGKGYAVREGFRAASGKYLLFMDADLSVLPDEFDKFIPALESGYDVVVGSRRLPDSIVAVHQPKWREFFGRIFYKIAFGFLIKGELDLNCGFKAYSREAAQRLYGKLTIYRWGFDTEIIYLSQKYSYKIKEVAVTWTDHGGSKVRLISAICGTLLEIFKIKLNDVMGKYDDDA